jgi:hypothetical protein
MKEELCGKDATLGKLEVLFVGFLEGTNRKREIGAHDGIAFGLLKGIMIETSEVSTLGYLQLGENN